MSTRKMNINDMQIKPWTTYEHRVMLPTKNDRNVHKLISMLCKSICIAIKRFFNWKLWNSSSFLFLTNEEYLSENVFQNERKFWRIFEKDQGARHANHSSLIVPKFRVFVSRLVQMSYFQAIWLRKKNPFSQLNEPALLKRTL